jgi:hypothetical protein
MTTIEKLDAFYDFSLEEELDCAAKVELADILESVIVRCKTVLETFEHVFTTDQIRITKDILRLAKDDKNNIMHGCDAFHWPLMRELMQSVEHFVIGHSNETAQEAA